MNDFLLAFFSFILIRTLDICSQLVKLIDIAKDSNAEKLFYAYKNEM